MNDIFNKIIEMGKQLLPVVEMAAGTTWVGAAVEAGQAVIKLIDGIKEASGQTPAELDATRDALEAAVNKHVDDTAANLRG